MNIIGDIGNTEVKICLIDDALKIKIPTDAVMGLSALELQYSDLL